MWPSMSHPLLASKINLEPHRTREISILGYRDGCGWPDINHILDCPSKLHLAQGPYELNPITVQNAGEKLPPYSIPFPCPCTHAIMGHNQAGIRPVLATPIQSWPSQSFHWQLLGHNSNSMGNLCCSKSTTCHQIATTFCTCHDSWAVMAYAKFCSDLMQKKL